MARNSEADPNTPEDTTRALVERYRADGFVAVRGVLAREEIETFRKAVDAAVARRSRRDRRTFDEKSPYGQSFIQCIFLWEDAPDVRPLTFHPKIAGLAADLLGAERVRLWHDQALYKEAGGRETEAHQDFGYWPVAEPDMVTAWIPLVDVDERNGCMGYVPGSQHSEREFVDIFNTPGAGNTYAARHAPPQYVPARMGDVIFHAARTVHMAMANKSGETRAVHTAVYFRDGCTRAVTGSDLPADRNGTLSGQPIEGPATPIAWPLPEGRFPTPAEWQNRGKVHEEFAAIGVLPMPGPRRPE